MVSTRSLEQLTTVLSIFKKSASYRPSPSPTHATRNAPPTVQKHPRFYSALLYLQHYTTLLTALYISHRIVSHRIASYRIIPYTTHYTYGTHRTPIQSIANPDPDTATNDVTANIGWIRNWDYRTLSQLVQHTLEYLRTSSLAP